MNKKIPCFFRFIQARNNVTFPKFQWVFRRFERILAFGFGIGLIRVMPGTCGTLFAWVLWILSTKFLEPNFWLFSLLFFFFFLGCWLCERVNQSLKDSDHVGIIWDEMVSFWLILWFFPKNIGIQTAAFFIFRIIDSLKPPPIRFLEKKLTGGVGIMLDDLLASLYTGLLLLVLF